MLNDGNRYDYRVLNSVKSEALFYYHTDHLGTPIAITDGTAAFAWRAELRPFGSMHSLSGGTPNNLRFTGQYLDSETFHHQNGFRDYTPLLGRYSTPDPRQNPFAVREALYPYSASNPVAYVDPLGLSCSTCCDTPGKRTEDKRRMLLSIGRELAVYAATHFYVPQSYCATYADLVELGITKAKPACSDSAPLFSKQQSLLGTLGIKSGYAPAHTATAIRPCNVERWEQGYILDAWPNGQLREFSWDDWRPGVFRTYTPGDYYPGIGTRGTCGQ